ncbi:hypothetical protein GARC_3714 [Paraglaciecola arctica BSs20135]|uniref:Uncharacterized protein n=1 Tax=Paraglaciecola arctica BSs20135 TaxID=493475 RepID=K6YVC6_9ALTE|nr:hypothetical protein GARC_3714 [Paraglaciecola arctica BSs20135]
MKNTCLHTHQEVSGKIKVLIKGRIEGIEHLSRENVLPSEIALKKDVSIIGIIEE